MATLVYALAPAVEITPRAGRATFTLQELQAVVGGYIEAIAAPDGRLMILNEDGKRLDLPFNEPATRLMRARLQFDDYIVGDVILCTRTELGESDEPES